MKFLEIVVDSSLTANVDSNEDEPKNLSLQPETECP